MRVRIVQIGNSKGLRIPKAMLTQLGLEDEVDLEVSNDALIVRRVREARAGWERDFAKAGPQPMFDPEISTATRRAIFIQRS